MAFERGARILLATAALAAAASAIWFGVESDRSLDAHVTEPAMPQPATPDPPAPAPLDQAPVGPLGWLEELAELKERDLVLPVEGAERDRLVDNFDETRGDGRRHEAIDILAPRNTPVVAVADGTIAKLFESVPGGHTIYQFDPEQRYCYYYAHLERYAPGLKQGDHVSRGKVVGYVGTSGNAPPDTPHLHFAIYRLGPDRRWWEGEPLNPYPVLRDAE
jgi:murein DD-endopeptidase MepM/ murein hydrolase activator NlpD